MRPSDGSGEDEAAPLVSALLGTLDTLAVIARRLHPSDLPALVELLGDQDAVLADARPERLVGPLAEATDLALSACADLRAAAHETGRTSGAARAFADSTRAIESLYPLCAELPAVARWFLDPSQRDDADVAARLQGPPAAGTGVLHEHNEFGQRGGVSVYVPEHLDRETPVPLVMALHGGSGHGRSMLWRWIRQARGRCFIVIAPTSTGATWSLDDPDVDSTHIEDALRRIRAEWSVDAERMLLTGMSDGGTFTLLSGLLETSPFTHLAPIAASFHPILLELSDPARLVGRPIYLVHGARDWMFPVEGARAADDSLTAAGARVTYREIADLSHAYPIEENALIVDWLTAE